MVLLLLDRHAGTPVYRQIVDQVRFQVASGVLRVDQELPSTRALAAEHGVNPMTVSKAYTELERDGVLLRRPGRPHVVANRPEEQAHRDRSEELAHTLGPAVQAALQLGIDTEQAAALFARLLETAQSTPKSTPKSTPGAESPGENQ